MICNWMIQSFIDLCEELNLPIATEKTEWGSTMIIFLGILLDGRNLCLCLPVEKQEKALKLLNDLTGKKKITVKQLQVLTGYLNFLTKAVVLGRVFTRRMYAKFSGIHKSKKGLKPHHHISIDREFRFDAEMWRLFLSNYKNAAVCRPMVDFSQTTLAKDLKFESDASANKMLGMGARFQDKWLFAQWELGYIEQFNPSIEYLELYALTAAVLTWGQLLSNQRILIYCDNESVVHMLNDSSSSCKQCMFLLRLLTLDNLKFNRRIFTKHIRTEKNDIADSLSRLQFKRFWWLAPSTMDEYPTAISTEIWPASKIWQKWM